MTVRRAGAGRHRLRIGAGKNSPRTGLSVLAWSWIVALAGLQDDLFARRGERDFVEIGVRVARLGRVTEIVLAAQFFLNLLIDVVDGAFLGDLKEAAAGLLGQAFQDL